MFETSATLLYLIPLDSNGLNPKQEEGFMPIYVIGAEYELQR